MINQSNFEGMNIGMGQNTQKSQRHAFLLKTIQRSPFMKDEELAKAAGVSVATIRIDRAELGIAQYRERIKSAAVGGFNNGLSSHEQLLDLNLYHDGISVVDTDEHMVFNNTNIIKSQYIYAMAENLALSVVDAKAALIKVANVKYISEVHPGERLIAKSEVIRVRENEYIVHVRIKSNLSEVFRGKFSLAEVE